jgi:hypothetical protein
MPLFFCFLVALWQQDNVSEYGWMRDSSWAVSELEVDGTTIYVFTKHGNEVGFGNAGTYARDVLERYNRWFGSYSFDDLTIVVGYRKASINIPQLVILDSSEDPFTRLFEVSIANAIGEQYFNIPSCAESTDGTWLGKGLAAYAAMRYMEDKYGRQNSLIKTSILPPLSFRYCHRLLYYIALTNQLETPISTSVSGHGDISVADFRITYSKPALFLLTLENILGRDVFDSILKEYYKRRESRRAVDFIAMCEGASDHDLEALFEAFLNTAAFCDWSVKRVTGDAIEIENKGELDIPVHVYVQTASGEHVFPLDASERRYLIDLPPDAGEVSRVVIDSSESTLDPDYWNNYYPRRISIKPVFDFDWPSFSTYQILWSPYLWYDRYDGVKAGFYVFGDKFADFDFVKGGYQVTTGYVRGFGSRRDYPLLTYQTPVLFTSGARVRVRFDGFRSRGGDNIKFGLISNLGRPLSSKPQIEIGNMFTYGGLFTYSGLDSIDWDLGKNMSIDNHFRYRHRNLDIDVGLSIAHHTLGSEWEYLKSTFEVKRVFEIGVPLSARLFVGKIFGSAPAQERLFLSGALRTTWLANLLFGQSGLYSPQERVHIPGEGNMLGYQTLHIKSDQLYVLNLEFPARSLIRVFTDIGYYDRFAFDAGVRLVIGSETFSAMPINGFSISLNLPLYSYIEGEPWKLRWSIGFSS